MAKITSAYRPHKRVQLTTTQPTMAKQSMKAECDINNIMRKYEKTGVLTHFNEHRGNYGNFIGFEDYHTSMNKIIDAQNAFMTLPAKVREKFQNDPRKFLEFAQNPENTDQMIEMGLATALPKAPVNDDDPAPTPTPPAEENAAEGA